MARLYAVLNDLGVVASLRSLEEAEVQQAASVSIVVDVQDMVVAPSIGWVLSGNQLVPPASQPVPIDQFINGRIRQFQEQAPVLLRAMYVANTLAGITTAQSDSMFDEYADVLARIREGAWPTAVYRLQQKQPSGFVTQAMIDGWLALLVAGMQ